MFVDKIVSLKCLWKGLGLKRVFLVVVCFYPWLLYNDPPTHRVCVCVFAVFVLVCLVFLCVFFVCVCGGGGGGSGVGVGPVKCQFTMCPSCC